MVYAYSSLLRSLDAGLMVLTYKTRVTVGCCYFLRRWLKLLDPAVILVTFECLVRGFGKRFRTSCAAFRQCMIIAIATTRDLRDTSTAEVASYPRAFMDNNPMGS